MKPRLNHLSSKQQNRATDSGNSKFQLTKRCNLSHVYTI